MIQFQKIAAIQSLLSALWLARFVDTIHDIQNIYVFLNLEQDLNTEINVNVKFVGKANSQSNDYSIRTDITKPVSSTV